MRAVAAVALFAVTTAFAAPRQDEAGAALDRASQAYATLKSARGAFTQTLTNPLTKHTSTARGEYQLDRAGGRWSLAFADPKGDRIVDDGKALWVYLPSTNPGQVIRLASAAGGTGMDLLDRFLGSPRTRYRIADAGAATVAGSVTRAVSLTPLKPMEFTKATVWIEPADGTLRQFEVTEPSGLVRRFTFTSVKRDGKLDASAFRFSPPKGVKVFDQARGQ